MNNAINRISGKPDRYTPPWRISGRPSIYHMWSANRPFSQSETELLRAQLNKVGPKELCCRLGARPLNTTHVWPRSTAPQPDGKGRESILRREENRSTRRKTLGVRLRSTETQPTYDPRPEMNLGRRGGRHGWWPLTFSFLRCKKIWLKRTKAYKAW